ncbi:hypothetical protein [Halodesulfovibrio sp. MK-HDV]|jgi:hypothetical protein|uniref:hypothetical protein n=1 Tax=Halodesulfovibrio sp. MK-HDV TaxID=2599925 RepID=UPI001370D9B7|nr:hypothetical protein [Halodesulfovibrio sp. MK-HDV]KAF1076255.1 hypothetical protein MKHDV_01276 [Halodesulfovibrio sp. MK-HDV]
MKPIRLSFSTVLLSALTNVTIPLIVMLLGFYFIQDSYDDHQRAKTTLEHYAQFEANTISTRMENVDDAYSKLLAVALPIEGTNFQGQPPGQVLSAFKIAHDNFIDSLYILTSYCQETAPTSDLLVNNAQILYNLKTTPHSSEYAIAIIDVKNGYSATISAAKECMKEKLRSVFEDTSNAN